MDVDRTMAGLRFTRPNFFGALICGALVAIFCLILLRRDPLVFWNDDYQISILPVFDDIARSWGEGHWPLLSPYSWVCGNLAGEYQYGTFSLFINAAVVVIWKIFSEFAHQAAALSIVHLIVLALGGFALARQRKLTMPLAIMVGLIAALNGWIICWGAPDWFGALGAFAWLPWAWWGMEKALEVTPASSQGAEGHDRRAPDATPSPWRFLWPAPFVYLVATGGFPYTVAMLGVLIAWLTVKSVVQGRNLLAPWPILLGTALGFGLAAPALLALPAYVHGSAREAQPASAHWQWIVPPGALPGLIVPSWTVNWADFFTKYVPHTGTELACGLAAPAALIFGLVHRTRAIARHLRWELALLGIVLMIAMLPTAGVFRWSFRWLPFFHLVLALCAAESLVLLGKDSPSDGPRFGWLSPATAALVLIVVVALAMKVFHTSGKYFLPLTAILIGLAAVWFGLEYIFKKGETSVNPGRASQQDRLSSSVAVAAWLPPVITFASLLATYLCIPPNCGVPRYNFTESLRNPVPLDPARLYLSIYPPAELAYRMEAYPQPVGQIVRPGSTSMWAKLHFINGYSPIRPTGVAKQFFFSIHGEIDPGTARVLLSDQAGPDGLLSQLGVDGIALSSDTDFNPQPPNEWEMIASTAEGRVFHRRGQPLARVRSVTSLPSRPGAQFVSATISGIHETRNQVEADIAVPDGASSALITFSRPYFDGYQARLGNAKLRVESEAGLFPVVEIPGGSRGRLTLRYCPAWLIYGSGLAVTCAALWIGGAVGAFVRRNTSR